MSTGLKPYLPPRSGFCNRMRRVFRGLLLWFGMAGCLCSPQLHAAQAGAIFGERLLRADGQGQSSSDEPLNNDGAVIGAEQAAAWRGELERVLQRSGPYDPELVEPLQGLANWHRSQGDLAAAEKSLSRALHLVRVNDGLKSERQLPLLRELIDLARQSGDVALIDDRYDYLLFLHGRPQPPYSDEQLATLLDYLDWQREVLVYGGEAPSLWRRRMLRLVEVNQQLMGTLQGDPETILRQSWQLVQSQLANFYVLIGNSAAESTIDTMPGYSRFSMNSEAIDVDRQRVEDMRRRGSSYGKQLLELYVAKWSTCSGICWDARLALADWCQWTGQLRRADTLYRELYHDLAEAGEQQRLARWFSNPVELPARPVFTSPVSGIGRLPSFALRFDVTDSGRVEEVASADDVPENLESLAGRVRRSLREVRFRPAFENGQAVARNGVERRYLWLPVRRSQ